MKSYPEYKETEIEWAGKLPSHWKVTPLKYAALVNREALTEQVEEDFELQYIDIGNVNQLGLVNPPERMKFIDAPSRARRVIKKNDTIISTVRTYLKAVAFIDRDDNNLIASTGFATLTSLNKTHPKYLYYLVSNQGFVDTVSACSTGVSYPAITSTELARITAWLPPLPEQQAIADFLDRKTAQIDTLIEKKQRQIDLLQEQRTALINHAVTKGLNPDVRMKDSGVEWLGEIPSHWKIMKIAYFVDKITNGYVGPTRDILRDDGVRYIQSLHIKKNTIDFHKPYYVSQEWLNEHERTILRENDVLVVQTGAIGEVGIVPKEFDGSGCHALIILRAKEDLGYGKFLLYALTSNYGYHSILSIMTGALHPHLNTTYLRDVYLAIPPKNEQQRIIEHIENKTKEIDLLNKKYTDTISYLQEYRTALISEAVTGKVDVR